MTAPISTASLLPVPTAQPSKARDAAKQFEALMIGQMLKSVRDAAAGDDDDSTGATMLDVADQQFAQVLANNGGVGLARMVLGGLQKTGETNANR
jgi:peptidoglycan hydrolase FlgJ